MEHAKKPLFGTIIYFCGFFSSAAVATTSVATIYDVRKMTTLLMAAIRG